MIRRVWQVYPAGVIYVGTVILAPLAGLLMFGLLRHLP